MANEKKNKNRKQMIFWLFLIVWVILSLIFWILGFSAFNDIHQDYISKDAAGKVIPSLQELPAWTACQSGWLIVRVDQFLRLLFLGGLVYAAVRWRKGDSEKGDPPGD